MNVMLCQLSSPHQPPHTRHMFIFVKDDVPGALFENDAHP